MVNSLKRFWNDESGPELVEWAVVTIILLVAAIVLYIAVGKLLGNVICGIQCWLSKAASSEGHKAAAGTGMGTCDKAERNDDGSCNF
ncbi:hypothetical protein DCC79_00085 [bacterium]|nr:hypothetical protein [Chloroflexi bacterium CFX6]RIL12757.1 MAG: hypothetical protein DCC79_00085 [bacterium]